jgi:hypothetical protein
MCADVLNSVEWADSKAHVCGLLTRWNGFFITFSASFESHYPHLILAEKVETSILVVPLPGTMDGSTLAVLVIPRAAI